MVWGSVRQWVPLLVQIHGDTTPDSRSLSAYGSQPQGDTGDQQVFDGGIPLVRRPYLRCRIHTVVDWDRTYIPDVSISMKNIAVSSTSRMMTSSRTAGVVDPTARSIELGVNDIRILMPVIDTDPHLPPN